MPRLSAQTSSQGDAHSQKMQRKTRHGRNNSVTKKKNHKAVKSSINNKTKTRQNGQSVIDASQDVDGEGGSTAAPEQADSVEEPDDSTLSDAPQTGVGENTPRLTGLNDNDMFNDIPVLDEFQSEAGAEFDLTFSEDDYAGVGNVSDESESGDEEDVIRSAEKDLIEEFERSEQRFSTDIVALDMHDMVIDEDDEFARQLGLHGPLRQKNDLLGVNMDEDPFLGLAKDDNLYHDLWTEAESAIWRMPETVRGRENSDPTSTQKRVRFEERQASVSAASSSSSEDPNDAFPDLFTASDDADVKRRLALASDQDLDHANMNDDAESFYDFEDEDEKLAFELDEESDSEFDSSTYESDDEGDTTDEESREEQIARLAERKRAAGKTSTASPPSTPVMADRAISTTSTPATSRPTTPRNGRGPRTGTFSIDPTRAAITTDAQGRRIKLMPPSQPHEKDRAFWERAKTANSSQTDTPPNSTYLTMPSPGTEEPAPPPLTAKSTLGSMFNGDVEVLRNHDISGIAEDLFPAVMNRRQTSFTTTTATDESEADMQDINMQDFLTMSDSEDSESDAAATAAGQNVFGRRESLPNGLLNHFDQYRGVVGSFRRNQHTARQISSLASHPGKRASTHEFNALQKGKRGAANTPMTPARKKRVSQDLNMISGAGVRKSMSNPLSASRGPRSRGNSLAGVNADLFQTLARNPFD